MRAVSFLIAMLGMLPFLVAENVSTIPPKFRVVLSISQDTWKPTSSQVQSTLEATQKFLENPIGQTEWKKAEIQKILKNTTEYRVQAWGTEHQGKKRIHLNFFPAPPKSGEDFHASWTKQQITVEDGGFSYWEAEVDVESEKVVVFRSNGYA